MTSLAREYGEGLYELARDEHLLDELHGELTEIAGLLKAQPEKVSAMRKELSAQGYAVPDPFVRDPNTPHVGRPPKAAHELEHSIRALLDTLCRNLIALTQGETAG